MSAEGHAPSHDDGHEHSEHAAAPPPDEPESPTWLPLLGGALFLLALFVYLVTDSGTGEDTAQAEIAAEAAAPTPSDTEDAEQGEEAADDAQAEPRRARPAPSALAPMLQRLRPSDAKTAEEAPARRRERAKEAPDAGRPRPTERK